MNVLRLIASCCPFFISPQIEFDDDFPDYEYDEDYFMGPQSTERRQINGSTARLLIGSPDVPEIDDLVVLNEPEAMPLGGVCNSTSGDIVSPQPDLIDIRSNNV